MYDIENIAAELQNMDGIGEVLTLINMPEEIAEEVIKLMK